MGDRERLSRETLRGLSRRRAGARVALQHRPILLCDGSIVCKTWRKSTKGEKYLTYRDQIAPRCLLERCATFENQKGKDVKTKQHWCPQKQDPPRCHMLTSITATNATSCRTRDHRRTHAQIEPLEVVLTPSRMKNPQLQ